LIANSASNSPCPVGAIDAKGDFESVHRFHQLRGFVKAKDGAVNGWRVGANGFPATGIWLFDIL
jgi:hypothetical protein